MEVVLMLLAGGHETTFGQNCAVSLLEWYANKSELIIVMEKPDGCKDLVGFLAAQGKSKLKEAKAKVSESYMSIGIHCH